jgi:hypothetical protein
LSADQAPKSVRYGVKAPARHRSKPLIDKGIPLDSCVGPIVVLTLYNKVETQPRILLKFIESH